MKKTTKKILTFMIQHPLFDILAFAFILYTKYIFLFNEIYIKDTMFFTKEAKIFTLITLVLGGLFFFFVSNKKRKIILLLLSLFLSITIFVDAVYFRYFKDFTSFSILYQIHQANDVKGTVFQLVKGTDIFYFLDIVVFSSLLILYRKKMITSKRVLTNTKKIVSFTLLSICLLVHYLFMVEYAGVDGIKDRNSNTIASCLIGAVNFHLLDSYDFIQERITKPDLTEQSIKDIRQSFEKDEDSSTMPYWGIMKGKNVLFVQMESFSQFVVNQEVEGKEITPHLNKLIKESYYANNFYHQVGDGHTSDAEFLAMNSLYPLQRGSASVLYGFNDYNSLPKILSKEGYSTFSAHAYREEFWNRNNMHKSLGFQESYFEKQYTIKDTAGFGMKDSDFFVQSIEKLSTLPSPFFSLFITLQNHTPFYAGDKSFEVGKLEGSQLGNYLQSVHEADKSIGVLIDELKKQGIYDNTMLVMYGDHDAELEKEELEKMFSSITEDDLYKFKKVPFLIHFPEQEVVKIDNQPLGEIDILPTVLDLLGIEPEHAYFYGENIFNEDRTKMVGTIENWYVGDGFIFGTNPKDESSYQAFDIETNKEIPIQESMIKMYEKMKVQTHNSDLLIRTNGIKQLMNQSGNTN